MEEAARHYVVVKTMPWRLVIDESMHVYCRARPWWWVRVWQRLLLGWRWERAG